MNFQCGLEAAVLTVNAVKARLTPGGDSEAFVQDFAMDHRKANAAEDNLLARLDW
jgi:hypothetical protein